MIRQTSACDLKEANNSLEGYTNRYTIHTLSAKLSSNFQHDLNDNHKSDRVTSKSIACPAVYSYHTKRESFDL